MAKSSSPPAPQEEQVNRQTTGSTSSILPPSIAKGFSHVMYNYGRFVFSARWFLLTFWIVALLVSIPFALNAPSVLQGGGYFNTNSESVDAEHILNQKLHQPLSEVAVAFQSTTTPVSDPAYQQEVSNFASRIKSFPYATSVTVGGAGKDGRSTYVLVGFNHDPDYMQREMPAFRALIPQSSAQPARAYLTGTSAVYDKLTSITNSDVERADTTALPIIIVVLLIVFGTIIAATMPLLLGITAVPVALAIIYIVALNNPTTSFILTVASIIGLGISIDYSLLVTRRYREELLQAQQQHGGDRRTAIREAVSRTIATAGEAILFSGITVMIGFLGLLIIGVQLTTSFAIGGAIVVAVAVLAALTLLPALLSILGTRINALRIPMPGRRKNQARQVAETLATVDGQAVSTTGNKRSFWHSWALTVMRRPVVTILVVVVLLSLLAWPAFSLKVGVPGTEVLPSSAEERQGLTILQAQFPDLTQNPIYVIAQSPDGSAILTPANLARVNSLSQWLSTQQHVTSVISLTAMPAAPPGTPMPSTAQLLGLYSNGSYQQIPALNQLATATTAGDTTVLVVTANTRLDSDEGKALIDHLRGNSASAAQGFHLHVGGLQALSLDLDRVLYRNFPLTILFILVATYLLLLLMFRSVLLPLKAVLMNILSVAATYGVLVFVFQWGNFGFPRVDFIDAVTPILLFCILFGLSMDYEVFLLSRIREEWLHTLHNQTAVAYGLEKTAGVITSAAFLFVIVTGSFTFTSLVTTQEIGVGMTVAILVDATIIRLLLVPATMRLLGRWNWWLPGRPLPPQ